VLWIRIGFNEDLDRAIYRNAGRIRIQEAKPKRIHADPDPEHGQTLKSRKLNFLHEKYMVLKDRVSDPDPH
jgi:hypothetical protein